MAKQQGATFSPFACETLGGLHGTAVDMINRVAAMSSDFMSLYPQFMLRRSLLDSVAMCIQRGNAATMVAASARSRAASLRSSTAT
jgi:hypothetical protein